MPIVESPPGTFVRIALSGLLLAVGATALHLAPSPSPPYMMVDDVVAHRHGELDGRELRIHGWVRAGSIVRVSPTLTAFALQKGGEEIYVWYQGPRPDTFKDQSEVVAHGTVEGTMFAADQLMTKCGGKYDGVSKELTTVYK